MKNNVLLCLCLAATLIVQAQKKQEVLNFIEKLPTIEYGTLPYWQGVYENTSRFIHGYDYHEYDTINYINNYLMKIALCDSSYVINKGKKVQVEIENVEFLDKFNFGQGTYVKNHECFSAEFTPPLYASAKSIYKDKFYVVYFWRASATESIYYYALVFDSYGNLLSYQHFDYWMVNPPVFPFYSPTNKIRNTDYAKTEVVYLPNKLLLAIDVDRMLGGGYYELSFLNKNGHYEIIKSWSEIGEVEESPVKGGKYVNYVGDNFEGNRFMIQIPFVVHDKDGYSNIRTEANGNAKIVRTINDGDMVWGTYLANGWCKIAFTADSNGKIVEGGYIHSSRLEKISDPYYDGFIKLPSKEEWEKFIKRSK